MLAYPDFTLTLYPPHGCLAKWSGSGAVSESGQQDESNRLRVMYSNTSRTDYHLHSGKLDFLALKWAVCDKFKDYLFYAPHFTVFTDNNPLTYVLSTAKLNAVGHRWVGQLADFHFDVKYRPG